MVFENFASYLDWTFFGNTGMQYANALGIFIASTIGFWFFRHIVLAWARHLADKTANIYDDLLVDFIRSIKAPLYYVLSLYIAAQFLVLPGFISKGTEYALALGVMYYAAKGINAALSHIKDHYVKIRQKDEGADVDTSLLDTLESVAHAVVWIVGILLILDNLGFDITALIAGLGIGGLAVAIAAQAVLADVLAAFSIYFDKPFKVGDFIIVGNDMGTVKYIGIKTTRIQTLQGQELVISNKELTESRVNNYKRMEKRRILFGFGVVYGTPVAKLKKIPGQVRKIIDSVPKCTTDRVHFKQFGASSLDYECVYYLG
ncbi:mechanosensitive ion channel family protein, partial [Candidatus Micrarchaeota archaeon]|nr:mechanosensitive ion channel family protein [Candidatus Micrarchaeota archaeon]